MLTYKGPDTRYVGREICFAYNEDSLTIVDMTNPQNGELLARMPYAGSAYTHQGWLTPDQAFLFLDDELDEQRQTGGNEGFARTYFWDVRDLQSPQLKGYHDQPVKSTDHNLYVKGQNVFAANYEAGLRILEYTSDVNTGDIAVEQVAFFDTYPESNTVAFNGAWSNYPYFETEDGEEFVVVQDINRGLFVLQATNLGKTGNITKSYR